SPRVPEHHQAGLHGCVPVALRAAWPWLLQGQPGPSHAAAEAQEVRDYHPICLIHIVAKVLAKALSLRLAPKLDRFVSRNQNAFILGRSLHDNFMLVRQSVKLLSQLGAPRVMLKLDLTRAFDSIS
uniref:Reverse transcriptase domain-containing protein n=1 Tax=Aegilops tauschii subsp. strangulata TaxID=200361 RepID=A0A452XIY3_AEGTS